MDYNPNRIWITTMPELQMDMDPYQRQDVDLDQSQNPKHLQRQYILP